MTIRQKVKKQLIKTPYIYRKLSYLINYRYYHWKPKKISSLNKIVELYADFRQDVKFVQIGANDGVMEDHLHDAIKNYHWKGVLVEPVEYLFNKLKKNYHDCKGLYFENSAISDNEETRFFYRLDNKDGQLPSWAEGLGSFKKDVILCHKNEINNFEKFLLMEKFDCITFDQLITKYNLYNLNFLQIDTEGYDYEILKSIDFKKYNLEIILFEHCHMKEINYKHLCSILKRNFKLVYHNLDTLAIQKEVFKYMKKYIKILPHINV